MRTTTLHAGPSRVELELLMRAAARAASPVEQGQQQARRVTSSLVGSLTAVAGTVLLYDVTLLLGVAP